MLLNMMSQIANMGYAPRTQTADSKTSSDNTSVESKAGLMSTLGSLAGKTVEVVKAQRNWLLGTASAAWKAMTLDNAAYCLNLMPYEFDISSAFEGPEHRRSVSVVEPQLQLASTRPERKNTSKIPQRIAGHQFPKKPEGVALTRPDLGKTGIPMPTRQAIPRKPVQMNAEVASSASPKQAAKKAEKESIFAFNTVIRDPYDLKGDLPAAETIRKLNEHARKARLRTPKERAARPSIKPISDEAYRRLMGKRYSKGKKAETTAIDQSAEKKVFKGDLNRLMKPLEGQKGEKFVSDAERVANFPKTLRT
ncbi:hypothetical protein [Endozoicomonas montiporae]|nr:hypothetical protein [Endozoicomonas montiporae]